MTHCSSDIGASCDRSENYLIPFQKSEVGKEPQKGQTYESITFFLCPWKATSLPQTDFLDKWETYSPIARKQNGPL